MTFTTKATSEIRERVKVAIDFELEEWKLGSKNPWDLASKNLNYLSITTIHGFFFKIILCLRCLLLFTFSLSLSKIFYFCFLHLHPLFQTVVPIDSIAYAVFSGDCSNIVYPMVLWYVTTPYEQHFFKASKVYENQMCIKERLHNKTTHIQTHIFEHTHTHTHTHKFHKH